jgi:hypothetical protein
MQQQGGERSGEMNPSMEEVCSAMSHGYSNWLLFNYFYFGMVRCPGLKLDCWELDLCLDISSYLLELIPYFALVSVSSDFGTVSGSPEIGIVYGSDW